MSTIFFGFDSTQGLGIMACDTRGVVQRPDNSLQFINGCIKVHVIAPQLLVGCIGSAGMSHKFVQELRNRQIVQSKGVLRLIAEMLEPAKGQERLSVFILGVESGQFVAYACFGDDVAPYDPVTNPIVPDFSDSGRPYTTHRTAETKGLDSWWGCSPNAPGWKEAVNRQPTLRDKARVAIKMVADEVHNTWNNAECSIWLMPRNGSIYRESPGWSIAYEKPTNHVRVMVYDASGNYSAASSEMSMVAGKAVEADISPGAVVNTHVSTASDITRLFTAGTITMPNLPSTADLSYGYDISLGLTVDFDDVSVVTSYSGWDIKAQYGTEFAIPLGSENGIGDAFGNTLVSTSKSWTANEYACKMVMLSVSSSASGTNSCVEGRWIISNTSDTLTIGSGAFRLYSVSSWTERSLAGGDWTIYSRGWNRSFAILPALFEKPDLFDDRYLLWLPSTSDTQQILSVTPQAFWDKGDSTSGSAVKISAGTYYMLSYYEAKVNAASTQAITQMIGLGVNGVPYVDQHIGLRGVWS